MEREIYREPNRAIARPSHHQGVPTTQASAAAHYAELAVGSPVERETDGWVVLGIDSSYFGQRLIAFDYTPAVAPAQIASL